MTYRLIATLCGLLALTGCGPVDEDPSATTFTSCLDQKDPPSEASAIRIGFIGEQDGFQELSDGTAIEKVFGFQGGSHIDLVAEVYGLDGTVEFTIGDGQGFEVGSSGEIPTCDGWAEAQARVFDPPTGMGMTFTVRVVGGAQEVSENFTVDIE